MNDMNWIDLEKVSDSNLITELKTRGYDVQQVYNTKSEALDSASYTELVEELETRGHHIEQEDKFHDFLFELYYDTVVMNPQRLVMKLNEHFRRELNKEV